MNRLKGFVRYQVLSLVGAAARAFLRRPEQRFDLAIIPGEIREQRFREGTIQQYQIGERILVQRPIPQGIIPQKGALRREL